MAEVLSFDMRNSTDSDVWFKDLYSSVNSFSGPNYNPYIGSVLGSILVGLSGIFPLLVIPIDGGAHFSKGGKHLILLFNFIAVYIDKYP